eukprot:1192017-Prorocentrum_minimum.AAC.3
MGDSSTAALVYDCKAQFEHQSNRFYPRHCTLFVVIPVAVCPDGGVCCADTDHSEVHSRLCPGASLATRIA